jgi:hypothetical protein
VACAYGYDVANGEFGAGGGAEIVLNAVREISILNPTRTTRLALQYEASVHADRSTAPVARLCALPAPGATPYPKQERTESDQ